jgi:tRNA nucleotidyltransferase/poly(A) polymerase
MKIYLVGGAVRDHLMGIESNDHDYVVVGATRQDMLDRGYSEVGADFPVFLDPKTGDQYALARRERKSGKGYLGFEVEYDSGVTLEEDLSRRDLTINAIAQDIETGEIIDPFNGRGDIKEQLLRHVSNAFKEDPLRVIRLARFYSRFADFGIASPTIKMCQDIVDSGEIDVLPYERLWAEMGKMFEQSQNPIWFFRALNTFGALTHVKFFSDIFGVITSHRLNVDFELYADLVTKMIPAEERLDFFMASVVTSDTRRKTIWTAGYVIPTRVIKLIQNMFAVGDMKDTHLATDIHMLLMTNRAYNGDSQGLSDLFTGMKIMEAAGRKLSISSSHLKIIQDNSAQVTAEPYMHLEGKEIGMAMNRARIAIIEKTLEQLKHAPN